MSSTERVQLFLGDGDSQQADRSLPQGDVCVRSLRAPDKATFNEDAAAVIQLGDESLVLAVADGVGAGALARAPSLVFNAKDELQSQWARRLCHRHVELPRHTLPSSQAFVVATLAGMGWGLHPQALIGSWLEEGALVELVPDEPLDVPLHWQQARAASAVLDGLTQRLVAAAGQALLPP